MNSLALSLGVLIGADDLLVKIHEQSLSLSKPAYVVMNRIEFFRVGTGVKLFPRPAA